MRHLIAATALCAGLLGAATVASAGEFYVGEPIVKEGMQFVPNYLTGIEMDRHPPGMAMGANTFHFEIDIHATKDEKHGFSEDAWIPYLTVRATVEKVGGKYKESKVLAPMTASDGPHYANNFKMNGDGKYKITYIIDPPSKNGFYRHVDKESGVPDWWKPITVDWTFDFPSKEKGK